MATRKYNFIHRKLVEQDDDLIGMVAYSLYKQEKIKWIEAFKKDNKRDPSENELKSFSAKYESQHTLLGLRYDAEQAVSRFGKSLIEAEINSIDKAIESAVLNKKRK